MAFWVFWVLWIRACIFSFVRVLGALHRTHFTLRLSYFDPDHPYPSWPISSPKALSLNFIKPVGPTCKTHVKFHLKDPVSTPNDCFSSILLVGFFFS